MGTTTSTTRLATLTDDNASAVQALWEAYLGHWVEHLRDGHATWADLVTMFGQRERQEEILAVALLRLAETSPKQREYNRGYVNGFRDGEAEQRSRKV